MCADIEPAIVNDNILVPANGSSVCFEVKCNLVNHPLVKFTGIYLLSNLCYLQTYLSSCSRHIVSYCLF